MGQGVPVQGHVRSRVGAEPCSFPPRVAHAAAPYFYLGSIKRCELRLCSCSCSSSSSSLSMLPQRTTPAVGMFSANSLLVRERSRARSFRKSGFYSFMRFIIRLYTREIREKKTSRKWQNKQRLVACAPPQATA